MINSKIAVFVTFMLLFWLNVQTCSLPLHMPTYSLPLIFLDRANVLKYVPYVEGNNGSREVIWTPIFIDPSYLPQNIKEKIDVLFGESTDTTEVDINDEVNLELGRQKKAQRKNKGR